MNTAVQITPGLGNGEVGSAPARCVALVLHQVCRYTDSRYSSSTTAVVGTQVWRRDLPLSLSAYNIISTVPPYVCMFVAEQSTTLLLHEYAVKGDILYRVIQCAAVSAEKKSSLPSILYQRGQQLELSPTTPCCCCCCCVHPCHKYTRVVRSSTSSTNRMSERGTYRITTTAVCCCSSE